MQQKNYIVNQVLPNSGTSMSGKQYRETLADLGYNFHQQIGSAGGCIAHKTLSAQNGILTRN